LAKLTPLPTQRVLKALQRAGWQLRPLRGAKHYVLVHTAIPGILTVPRHRETKKGTLSKIIKQAGLSVAQFQNLYK